jgi:hypothetical protein
MTEEPREPTPEELAAKRAAFDRVLAAALAECTDMISLYDCAIWILYACTRSDAINTAKELAEENPDENFESPHTIRYEIDDALELIFDDEDAARTHELDIKTVGEQLDPDFDAPAHRLRDWLDTIDSSRRAVRTPVK